MIREFEVGDWFAADCVIRQRVSGLRRSPRKCANCARVAAIARPIGTGERSNVKPLRVPSIISLRASNSVPMTAVANARSGQESPYRERCDRHLELPVGEKRWPEHRLLKASSRQARARGAR